MTKKENSMLKDFVEDFNAKEVKRKELRLRIVKSLDKIESELYDDKDSSNEGLLTRVNRLDEAIREIVQLVRRTKIRNELILGILGALVLAVISQLLSHYLKLF